MLDLRDDWAFDFAMIQRIPVNALKERMLFHKSSAADAPLRDVPKSLRRIDGAECPDQVLCVLGHALRVFDLAADDAKDDLSERYSSMVVLESLQLVYFHRVGIPKWRLSDQEFVHQDAKSPPVDGNSMT